MYLTETTTVDLYNDTNSNFSELISFFPNINYTILNSQGIEYEFNDTYRQHFNRFPLKNNINISQLIILGLFETRKQIHQKIEIIYLYNPNEINENNKGLLYNLVKNWGPMGENILNDNCLKVIKVLMEYIAKKVDFEKTVYDYVNELDLSKDDMDDLIKNISKIDIKRHSIEDIQNMMANLGNNFGNALGNNFGNALGNSLGNSLSNKSKKGIIKKKVTFKKYKKK